MADESPSVCLCQKRTKPLTLPLDYPTLKEGDDPIQVLKQDGYFVVRGFLSSLEVQECREAISDICNKWYVNFVKTGQEGPDWEEVANRRPDWKKGKWQPEPGQEELGFRKLYRMTQHQEFTPFFAKMCRHPKVTLNLSCSCNTPA